jgi:nitroreductase
MQGQTVNQTGATGSMDLFRAMRELRAMRRLKPDPVPDELLWEVVELATYAPSQSNSQMARFLVVTDPELRRAIAGHYREAVAWCWENFNLGPQPHQTRDEWERLKRAVWWQGNHLAEVPALVFPCAAGLAGLDLGNHLIASSVHGTVWPAVQNFLLACRAKGLGATLTTLHLLHEERVDALLGIPEGVRTFGMVPVGWPMGRFGPVRRRPADELLAWNRWS